MDFSQWRRQSFEVGGKLSETQPRSRSPGVYYVRVGETASAEGNKPLTTRGAEGAS